MDKLPPNQKTPIKLPNTHAKKQPKQAVLHNPLLVSLRHQNGRRRHIHCISVDILEDRIGVTFRGAQDRARYFTEWFDRKFWHVITGDERKAYYKKREEYRELVKDEAYQKRVAARLARDKRRMKRLGIETEEDLKKLEADRRRRRVEIVKAVNAKRAMPVVEELPAPTLEQPLPEPTPPPAPEPTDSDTLTPDEAAALDGKGPVRPLADSSAGNLNTEAPGEYNAMLHMKTDKHPFGSPEKLMLFDALVSGEAIKQEAMRKIAQRKRAMETRRVLESGEAVWSSD